MLSVPKANRDTRKIIYDFPKRNFFLFYEVWTIFHPDLVAFPRFVYFWRMKSHLLNFNEMNSACSLSTANIEMCNKQCDRKKENLVNGRWSWGDGGEREQRGMKKCCPSYTLLLGYVHGHERIISLSFRLLFEISFFFPRKPFLSCCWWLLVSVAGQ